MFSVFFCFLSFLGGSLRRQRRKEGRNAGRKKGRKEGRSKKGSKKGRKKDKKERNENPARKEGRTCRFYPASTCTFVVLSSSSYAITSGLKSPTYKRVRPGLT